ncbi:hypothetical protein DPMN_054375 [Dreissena polymorpha]|uniref:Uncharacterized protein n=1 Tax=Dreissena polymorpha TaxID=45954 RepID=A0A9D4CN21_DREPO|nr:hypothetical protein DPMN_054375 [Dreissena polymorpha]
MSHLPGKKNLFFTSKTATAPGSHVFQPNRFILKLDPNTITTNVLRKFNDYWANMMLLESSGSHVFQWTGAIHQLGFGIITTIILSKFHDRAKMRSASTPRSMFFLTRCIFQLGNDIIRTNVPTKFHYNWVKNANSRVFNVSQYAYKENCTTPLGNEFQQTRARIHQHILKLKNEELICRKHSPDIDTDK